EADAFERGDPAVPGSVDLGEVLDRDRFRGHFAWESTPKRGASTETPSPGAPRVRGPGRAGARSASGPCRGLLGPRRRAPVRDARSDRRGSPRGQLEGGLRPVEAAVGQEGPAERVE